MQTNKREEKQRPSMFTWKQLLLSFAFLIGMIPICLFAYYRNNQRKSIRQAPQLTTGVITRFVRSGNGKRNWYDVYANHQVNNHLYTCIGRTTIQLTSRQQDSLIGVRLPVIYEKDAPDNAHLLASTRAFNRFNFDLPDSLSWTTTYFTD